MNLDFRSSSELQGEVDPTWWTAAFEKDFPQNKLILLTKGGGLLPEVGDLQRSSETFDPSLDSQSAAGATEMVSKDAAEAVFFLSFYATWLNYWNKSKDNCHYDDKTKQLRVYKSSANLLTPTVINVCVVTGKIHDPVLF